jgi:thioredoxin-like negative regulator of GroEL
MSNSPVGRGTEGFPSIMLFKKGKLISKYNGERSPEKMADFVNQAMEPIKRKKMRSKTKSMSKAKGKTKKLRRKN